MSSELAPLCKDAAEEDEVVRPLILLLSKDPENTVRLRFSLRYSLQIQKKIIFLSIDNPWSRREARWLRTTVASDAVVPRPRFLRLAWPWILTHNDEYIIYVIL